VGVTPAQKRNSVTVITLWGTLTTVTAENVEMIVRLNILKIETKVKGVKNFTALGLFIADHSDRVV
jgi:hypothetical protein